jgi:hypothetical protein
MSVGTRSVATAFLIYDSSQLPLAAFRFSLFDLPRSIRFDTSAQHKMRLSLEYMIPSKSVNSAAVRAAFAFL